MLYFTKAIYRRKTFMLSSFVTVMVLSVLDATPIQARTMNDPSITTAIEDELIIDQGVRLNDIEIQSNNGIVTLSGSVNNILAKERAVQIAQTVKGVRSVVNRIKVEPGVLRSNSEIKKDVVDSLLSDPATESYQVKVSVDQNGTVSLSGVVDSWHERNLIETVTKGTRGVTEVINDIRVEYESDRSDREIKSEIKKTLHWNVLVDHAMIDVTVNDGKVNLSGTVGSAAEKRIAENNAWIAGVHQVDTSDLEVKHWARDKDLRKNKYAVKSDTKIEEAIEDAFLHDPRVKSFNVTANVSNGVATLRGEVNNLKAKRSAKRTASHTVGVIDVKNHIKVNPDEEMIDENIADRVSNALERDPYIEHYEITVTVEDGVAHLNGTVDSYFEKGQADDIAARVDGVVKVNNNLTVNDVYDYYAYDPYVDRWDVYDHEWYDYQPPYTLRTDTSIKNEVRDQLWWSPFVDAGDINVKVDDGIATLTGTVDTWSEYHAAAKNAFDAGATWVDNDLNVQ